MLTSSLAPCPKPARVLYQRSPAAWPPARHCASSQVLILDPRHTWHPLHSPGGSPPAWHCASSQLQTHTPENQTLNPDHTWHPLRCP